jgi:aquaporin Z
MSKKLGAEFLGTFWLALGGCGAAVLAAGIPGVGIGYMGVAFAFGLTVLTMVYAIGPISGPPTNVRRRDLPASPSIWASH